MRKLKEKFPKKIYVGKDTDNGSEWLCASEDYEDLEVTGDIREIGIYELVKTAKIVNKSEVVECNHLQ